MIRRNPFAIALAAMLIATACSGDDAGGDAASSSEPLAAAVDDASASSATDTTEDAAVDAEPAESSDDPVEESAAVDETDEPEPAPEPVFPRTVVDALGNEYVLEEPARIACAWTGCLELHATLGAVVAAGDPLAGFETSPMFFPVGPPEFIPARPGDLESWAEAEVDFAISRVPENVVLESLGDVVDIFYLNHPSYGVSSVVGFEAYLDNIDLVGQLLGRDAEAARAIERLEAMVDDLSALSTPELAARSVAILFAGDAYQVIGDENPFCDVLAITGLGECLAYDTGELSGEAFLAENPDWIIYQGGGQSTADRDDPVWDRLAAVQDGRVIDSLFGQYYCCGDRTLLYGLQEFIAATIPEAGVPAPGDPATFDPDTSPLLP